MDSPSCEALAIEIRALTMIMAKFWRQSIEQRLQAEGLEISWLQHGIMRHTLHHGASTISEMSHTFMCDPSTLVPSIDGLERKGLVSRNRDPNDRRRVPVSLTDEGRALIDRIDRTDVVNGDDPLLRSIQKMGADKAEGLVMLLREMISSFPDGQGMVEHIQSRVAAFQATQTRQEGSK